jgi:hypothetical protein
MTFYLEILFSVGDWRACALQPVKNSGDLAKYRSDPNYNFQLQHKIKFKDGRISELNFS